MHSISKRKSKPTRVARRSYQSASFLIQIRCNLYHVDFQLAHHHCLFSIYAFNSRASFLLMPVGIHLNIQYPVHTPVEVADVMLHISALLLSMVPPPRSRSMGRILSCSCRELAHSTQGPISQVNKLCYSGTHGVAVPESMCLTAPLIGSRGSELAANDGAYLFADPCRLPALVQPPPERSEKKLDGLPATQRAGLPSWPT